ncbi:tail fiber protein [Brevundimonas sp.]|uniref:phage tail protein n=1 Tax=Brevundimonas sp. TaxID=1871086 RepID=UPI0028A0FAD6|nr:tail fiber protein [Brevundimonas sp.]
MSDQFVGEIRWFPYLRGVPNGWQTCDGSLMRIADYEILYTLLGVQYGGDGVNTFGVPDLRGRLPIHQGQGQGLTPRLPAQMFGTEGVTLQSNQLGGHTHLLVASSAAATTTSPGGNLPAALASGDTLYVSGTAGTTPGSITNTAVQPNGGNQAHENRAPTLTLRAAIAWTGQFPTQN